MASAKEYRLRKHADYQGVYKRGRKQFTKNIAYFSVPRAEGETPGYAGPRVGLTVPKALGKAVDRNRIKRRMREAVRANQALLEMQVDVVLHPRRTVLEIEFSAVVREVAGAFRRISDAAMQRVAKTTGREVDLPAGPR